MEDIAFWYKNEVQRWRTGASVAWAQLLLPPITLLYVAAASLDPFHPAAWITNCLSLGLPSKWSYYLFFAAVMCVLAVWESKHYTVRPNVLSTRLAYMWNVLSPHRLLFTTGHALGAGVATWCLVNLVGGRFSGLSIPCHDGSPLRCVNEYHLFVVLHGAVLGATYAIRFFIVPYNVLTFPIIQQSRFFQLKSQLYPTLKCCLHQVLRQLPYFYLSYFILLGPVFKGWIARNLRINQSTVGVVDTLYSLMDVGLLWRALVTGAAVHFVLTLAQRLYNIYQTEPFHFPIEAMFEEDQRRALPKALTSTQLPIVQYLAYQDLCVAAMHSPPRRRELFSLSQPGGHPHNWVAVSGACLGLLRDITARMADFNRAMLAGCPTRQLSGDRPPAAPAVVATPIAVGTKHGQSFTNGSSFMASSSMTPVTNLSYRGPPVPATTPATMTTSTAAEDKKGKPTISLGTKLLNHFKKRKAVAFFLADLPDAPSMRLYADCQIDIWAVEAISYLASASFSEDKYGVVQNTLPDIISTLLSLQEAVEKHLKLAPNTNRKAGARGSPAAADATQRHSLKLAIKTALYRIVNTFDKHLSAIQLGSEHARRLKLFMEYKE